VSKLPVISGAECVKALTRAGFTVYPPTWKSYYFDPKGPTLTDNYSKSQRTRSWHIKSDH